MDAKLTLPWLVATALCLPAFGAEAPQSDSSDWRVLDKEFTTRHEARRKALEEDLRRRARERELEEIAAGEGVPVTGETFADPGLQKRVFAGLVEAEHVRAPECTDHTVVLTEALGRDVEERRISERWVLDRCGERVAYRLDFSPFFTRGRGFVILDERSSVVFSPEPKQ